MKNEVAQSCSLPGSSVHGVFQARVLEWGAIAYSAIKSDTFNSVLMMWTNPESTIE